MGRVSSALDRAAAAAAAAGVRPLVKGAAAVGAVRAAAISGAGRGACGLGGRGYADHSQVTVQKYALFAEGGEGEGKGGMVTPCSFYSCRVLHQRRTSDLRIICHQETLPSCDARTSM